jgi:RecG-like helicase
MYINRTLLIKISLIGFILTFLMYYFYDLNYEPKIIEIGNINLDYYQILIGTQGIVDKHSKTKNGHHFFKLKNPKNNKTINIIFFNSKDLNLKNKDKILVYGRVNLNKGIIQIIGYKLKFI